ncbi:MAG TPA: branched-chain amino acid ABC transporter permease [Candidatus Paceibacterota bacterium]
MDYLLHIAILASIWSILALSLNLVVGEMGLVSLAHAAFFGIGAYTTALITQAGMNFFLALFIGMGVAALCALLIGAVLSRFKGDIYVLGSLGFTVIVYSLFLNAQDITHGPLGIAGIMRPTLFGFSFSSSTAYLILSVVFLAVTYACCVFVTNSAFGRIVHAIREDETIATLLGYRTVQYKLLMFIIAASFAALAGSLYASYISFIDPSSFTLNVSIFILATIILGGLANSRGAILGAVILIALPEALRFVGFPTDIAAQMRLLTYGAILIALMLYRPQGLLGTFRL